MNLPKDPYILLSYINTKLRNNFHTLEDLCMSLHVNQNELTATLAFIGYIYDQAKNKFIPKE